MVVLSYFHWMVLFTSSETFFLLGDAIMIVYSLVWSEVFRVFRRSIASSINITIWLSLGTVHDWAASLRAAAWLAIGIGEARVVWAIGAIVISSLILGLVITHREIVGTFCSIIFRAAWWMPIDIAVIVGGVVCGGRSFCWASESKISQAVACMHKYSPQMLVPTGGVLTWIWSE